VKNLTQDAGTGFHFWLHQQKWQCTKQELDESEGK